MRRVRWVSGLLACAAFAVPALAGQAAAPPRFTVEEMLKLRRVSDPQLSPDGTRVAYVMTEVSLEGNTRASHIWTVAISGGDPVAFARSDRSDDTPRWSPDGTRLAFVSTRDGSSQIWIAGISPTGSAAGTPRKLTSLATEAAGPRWSPDGKWIAFVSDVFPDCDSLACNDAKLKELESRKSRAHVFDQLLFRHWTSWKDGRFSHLFVAPADGSAPPRDLTPGRADVPPFSLGGPDDYAFSPDSREIAYAQKTDRIEAISTNTRSLRPRPDHSRRDGEEDHPEPGRGRRSRLLTRWPVHRLPGAETPGLRGRSLAADAVRSQDGRAALGNGRLGPVGGQLRLGTGCDDALPDGRKPGTQ